MAMRTIMFRLCAPEETRRILWNYCEQHTLLVNALSGKIRQSENFEDWQQKGKIARKHIEKINKEGLNQLQGAEIPPRFITSAILSTQQMWKSWFALQKQRHNRLTGKENWLKLQEHDLELAKTTDFTTDQIRAKAQDILLRLTKEIADRSQTRKQRKRSHQTAKTKHTASKKTVKNRSLTNKLFKLIERTKDLLTFRAAAYLLRNNSKIREAEESLEEISLQLEGKRIEIARLRDQLQSQYPKYRDPTGQISARCIDEAILEPSYASSLKILLIVYLLICNQRLLSPFLKYHLHLLQELQHPNLSKESLFEEFETWEQACEDRLVELAKIHKSLPYPILFESSDDLYWSLAPKKDEERRAIEPAEMQSTNHQSTRPKRKRRKRRRIRSQDRIYVQFKGLSQYKFGVQCSHRHLPILQQCQREWKLHRSLPDDKKFGLGLFPVRAAQLIWRKDKQQYKSPVQSSNTESESEKWRQYRLYLHITIDSRALTAEGTEQVRQEKLAQVKNDQKNLRKRKPISKQSEETELTKEQKEKKAKDRAIAKKRLNSTEIRLNQTLDRPSRPPYQGLDHIQIRVCFSQEERASVVVFDTQQQQVLQYVSIRDLLFDHSALAHHKRFTSNPKRKGKRSLEQMQLEQYHLLERLRKQHIKNQQKRRQEHKRGNFRQSKSESNLGTYVDCLIAARIGQLAVRWQASLIVIPDLGNIRESVEAWTQAWADQIFPKMEEVQRLTTKEARMRFHGWSYGRLAHSIRNRAARDGLVIATGQQPQQGSLLEKAIAVAPAASAAS